MKILVVKPSSLGDILHTFPALAELHAACPEARLTWVANDSLAQIVQLYPRLEKVIPFPRKALGKFSLRALRGFLHDLRSDEYDAVIDFQGLLRSGIITWLAHARMRIGFAQAREGATFAYHHAIETPPSMTHAADKNRYLARALLEKLGLTPVDNPPEPLLALPQEWQDGAEECIQRHRLDGGPLLAVGCASRWSSKSWAPEFFAQVLRQVRSQCPEVRIWLLGSPDERGRAQEVCAAAAMEGIVNLAGETDLGTLAALLARSKALFTNDSGPMHIAAGLRIPCVANFGSTDPDKTGPYGPAGRHHVVRSRCPEAPCFRRECPRKDPLACCGQASPEEAAQAILERL
ncbi:MAG: lipopolysaccharide heptosyltransferase II [Victivallales bacterium]|nr:lipopolysaccharide heptosyltransferase II [Victivallales bacterium]